MNQRTLLGAALYCAALTTATAADLTITVDGARNTNGALALALFNSESSFPRAPLAIASARMRARQEATFTFHDLAPGMYAISAYHDENDNGKLDADAIGFPTEGLGFSNDARITTGPPAFAKAAFELRDEKKKVSVKVLY